MQRACLRRKYNAIIDLLMTENALNGQGSQEARWGPGRGALAADMPPRLVMLAVNIDSKQVG